MKMLRIPSNGNDDNALKHLECLTIFRERSIVYYICWIFHYFFTLIILEKSTHSYKDLLVQQGIPLFPKRKALILGCVANNDQIRRNNEKDNCGPV